MKMHRSLILLVGLLLGADAPPKDAVEKELKKLEGDWLPVCIKEDRRVRAPASMTIRIERATMRIKAGREDDVRPARIFDLTAEVKIRGRGEERALGTLTINPLKELPTFDLAVEKDLGLGGTTLLGIYKWEGKVLKLGLVGRLVGDRPTRFNWVVIMSRDSQLEREAAKELAEVLPFEDANSKAKCRTIVKKFPNTAAAMIAQDYLHYGLVAEHELQDVKKVSALLNGAKNEPKAKARAIYLDIIKKYPKTMWAKEASTLRIAMDEPDAAAELKLAKKLADDDKKKEAKQAYRKIVDSYPQTGGAKEAEQLLVELNAGMALEVAQELAKKGFKAKACENCLEVISQYSTTVAAGEAKEMIAGIRLEEAQNLAENGSKLKAYEICKQTIRLYPETAAAKKCQDLLRELTIDLEAAWKLNLAKYLAEDGLKLDREDLKEKAKARCQEIVKMYPRSKYASQAKELLERLSN